MKRRNECHVLNVSTHQERKCSTKSSVNRLVLKPADIYLAGEAIHDIVRWIFLGDRQKFDVEKRSEYETFYYQIIKRGNYNDK
jgi:hypothetical protein